MAFIGAGLNVIKESVRGVRNAKFVTSVPSDSLPSYTVNNINPQPPKKIAGYTRHGINQAISRDGHGVSVSGILDAFKNPKSITYNANRQTFKFTGQNSVLILNNQGKVVSTWATSSVYWRY